MKVRASRAGDLLGTGPVEVLTAAGVRVSMDGRGRWMDNIMARQGA
jgi:hypothetical protein